MFCSTWFGKEPFTFQHNPNISKLKIFGLAFDATTKDWTIIQEGKEIIKTRGDILSVGVHDDKFLLSGTDESKIIAGCTSQMARRLLFRSKLRRAQLKRILLSNDMLPDLAEHKGKLLLLPFMGRILLHLNQRMPASCFVYF